MSQMRLITDSRDEWTVKELVETLHAKVDDLERKLDAQLKRNEAISWQLQAIILHLTGDRAALTAFVMASEPTVVPNEDEAMPVVEPVIVQDEPAPRKKRRLPDPIRVIGQQFRDLHEQADAKAEERAKVLAASKGRETAESVDLLVQEQDLRTKAREFQKQYDKDRRPFANPRKPKAAKAAN